jgi:hypothetical protein
MPICCCYRNNQTGEVGCSTQAFSPCYQISGHTLVSETPGFCRSVAHPSGELKEALDKCFREELKAYLLNTEENRTIVYKVPALKVTETETRIEIEPLTVEELCSAIPSLTDSRETILTGGCELSGSYPNYSCDNDGSCKKTCKVKSTTSGSSTIYYCACE